MALERAEEIEMNLGWKLVPLQTARSTVNSPSISAISGDILGLSCQRYKRNYLSNLERLAREALEKAQAF